LLSLHPWLSIAGLRGCLASAAEFYSVIGEPPEMAILPGELRMDRLVTYWRLHALHERERLRFAGQERQEWLDDDREIDRLADAWIGGWRGPHEPIEIREQGAASTQEVASTSQEDLRPAPPQAGRRPTGDLEDPWSAPDVGAFGGGGAFGEP